MTKTWGIIFPPCLETLVPKVYMNENTKHQVEKENT